jgi:hypothetical protein
MEWCATEFLIFVAHVLVRHRMLIFVAKILWSTTHAPQNTYIGAPQKRFSLLVAGTHASSRDMKPRVGRRQAKGKSSREKSRLTVGKSKKKRSSANLHGTKLASLQKTRNAKRERRMQGT